MRGRAAATKGGSWAGEDGGRGGERGEWMNVGEQRKKGESLECVGGMERRSEGGCGSWW